MLLWFADRELRQRELVLAAGLALIGVLLSMSFLLPVVGDFVRQISPSPHYYFPLHEFSYFEHGLTRRALIGTITLALGMAPSEETELIVYVIGSVFAAVVVSFFAVRATRNVSPFLRMCLLLLLTLSPALFAHFGFSPYRQTPYVIGFAAAAMWAGYAGRFALAAVFLTLAGLIHETAFDTFGPVFFLLGLEIVRRSADPAQAAKKLYLSAAACIVAFVAVFFFATPTPEELWSLPGFADRQDANNVGDPYLPWRASLSEAAVFSMCMHALDWRATANLIPGIIFLILHPVVLFWNAGRWRMAAAMIPVLVALLMIPIAIDAGRFFALSIMAIWLYLFGLLGSGVLTKYRVNRWALLVLLAPYVLGPLGIAQSFPVLARVLLSLFGPGNLGDWVNCPVPEMPLP